MNDSVKRNHLKRLFIGNPNAYALQHADGWETVRKPITDVLLDRHIRGEITMGSYLVRLNDDGEAEARMVIIDLDMEDPKEAAQWAAFVRHNFRTLGVHARHIGVSTTGNRGLHIFVPIAAWVPAAEVRRLAMAGAAGVQGHVDIFPKQEKLKAGEGLGSQVRLPFGTHRKTGKQANFITPIPLPMPVHRFRALIEDIPEISGSGRGTGQPPVPYHCMDVAQDGPGEGQRNTLLTHLATMLRRGGLNEENVSIIVRRANDASDDPLDEREVYALLRSSQSSGPLCGQLDGTEAHCGEACIMARRSGLWNRKGDVTHGAEGEKVVVEIGKRDSANVVEVIHPDGVGKFAIKKDQR